MKQNCFKALALMIVCSLVFPGQTQSRQMDDAKGDNPIIARIAGNWVGTDTATGMAYYRLELDRSGTGFVGMAVARVGVMVWKIEGTRLVKGDVAVFSLVGVENAQPRTASVFATNHWETIVLEMQMNVDKEGSKGVPLAAQRILLRQESELRQLDRSIRETLWTSERSER